MRRRKNTSLSHILFPAFKELADVLVIDFDALAYGGISHLNPNWQPADQHWAVLTC
jgi:hypothetical protein